MQYNFDDVLNRRNTLSYKWDGASTVYPGSEDLLPLWVADMDFPCPQDIVDAVQARAQHPIYGYCFPGDKLARLAAGWQEKRNGWHVDPKYVAFSNGVVPAINAMVTAFTEKGDGVIIQPPVYYPFQEAIINNGRMVSENQLNFDGARWGINFDNLEALASQPENKLMILCNPHNPVSRVWEKDELLRIADICVRNHVLIASDEIHSDLVYRHSRHIPIASLSEEISRHTITAVAPSKTFNIAGLQMSAVIASNPDILDGFKRDMVRRSYTPNLFGAVAFQAAYQKKGCVAYLEQLIDYLWDNYIYVDKYLKRHMPKIHCQRPEATYLLWLDCTELGLDHEQVEHLFTVEAGVAFDSGIWFGGKSKNYMRINVACPRATLKVCMDRMHYAYKLRNF